MKDIDLAIVNAQFEQATAFDILRWCYDTFPAERIKMSTSFGAEGMVLLHMLVTLVKTPQVFTIDTGRLFQETYDVWQEVVEKYGIAIETFFPDPEDIAALTTELGPNLFFKSIEERKRCCYVRKIKPLKKALANIDVWITALRRDQAESRGDIPVVSWSEEHRVFKVCPLLQWTEGDVWEYVRNNGVPYDKLYDQGYPTIGCRPCTRPLRPAEDKRSGRWWWEDQTQKECGIHIEQGKVVRKPARTWTI